MNLCLIKHSLFCLEVPTMPFLYDNDNQLCLYVCAKEFEKREYVCVLMIFRRRL